MPSVSSSSRPKVLLSSTVITPSLPTLSIASAIISPIDVSPAEMEAVEAICSLVSTSLASLESSSLTRSTADSMPRLSDIGLAPAATLRRPSRTSACASTVAVVVPSPATSSVFLATSLTSSAPIFSHGSSSSISLAMDTPSLVIVGAPHFFSSTTFRPLGPRVTFTTSASWFIPRSRPRLASSLYAIILAAIGSSPPETMWLSDGSSRRPRRPALPCVSPFPHRSGLNAPIPPSAVTLMPRVPTTCLALSGRECKPITSASSASGPLTWDLRGIGRNSSRRDGTPKRGPPQAPTTPIRLRRACRHRYNQGMSATEKLAISLPKDLIEKLRRAKDEGRIDSVSGYIAELLRREDDWHDARATLDRIFEECPGPEAKHYAWARRALGVGPKPVG